MAIPLSPRAMRTPTGASQTPGNGLLNQRYGLFPSTPRDLRASLADKRFPGHRLNLGIGTSPSLCRLFASGSCTGDGPGNGPFVGTLECQLTASSPRTCQPSIMSHNTAAIYHVFRNLKEPFELARAATVSRLWRDVASVPSLWTALLEKEHIAASQPSMQSLSSPSTNGASVSDRRRAPHEGRQHQLLPQDLLQPPWDALRSPAAQLGRWLGMRRLVSAASRLEGVRGTWAAYAPETARLVVLDQEHQKVAFVDLGGPGPRSSATNHLCGSSGGVGVGPATGVPGQPCHNDTEERRPAEHSDGQRLRSVQTRVSGLRLGPPDRSRPQARSPRSEPAAVAQVAAAAAAAPMGITHVPVPGPSTPSCDNMRDASAVGPDAHATAAQGAAGLLGPQPAGQQGEDGVDGLQSEERNKLQVVVTCGNGMVATGHPDGRVLVWDSAQAALAYTLPVVEGCGRGPVFAMAGDGDLLAVAYRREVLVWDMHEAAAERRVAASSVCGAQALHDAASRPALAALIRPTLETAVRSMALSARHGVLAMRSWDGVELREARGGRWLHSLPDRRNTALLAAGDVLFIASSSPSFLGNSFLEFEIEVAAVDLAAVMAVAGAADAGDTDGSPGSAAVTAASPPGNVAAVGATPSVQSEHPRTEYAAAPIGNSAGDDGDDGVSATTAGGGGGGQARRSSAPLVIRTVTPPQRFTLRGRPLAAFKWDQPMQLCLSGGMLLLRCLQFPLSAGQLAWPGMFAFRLGDILAGLSMGRTASKYGGSGSELEHRSPHEQTGRDGIAGGPTVETQQQGQLRGIDESAAAANAPETPNAADSVHAAVQLSEVVKRSTIQPEVLCGDGGFATWSAGQDAGGVLVRHSAASMQLLAAARRLVIVSESQDVWVMDVPYCGSRKEFLG